MKLGKMDSRTKNFCPNPLYAVVILEGPLLYRIRSSIEQLYCRLAIPAATAALWVSIRFISDYCRRHCATRDGHPADMSRLLAGIDCRSSRRRFLDLAATADCQCRLAVRRRH